VLGGLQGLHDSSASIPKRRKDFRSLSDEPAVLHSFLLEGLGSVRRGSIGNLY
jgi:hypothetical protein